MAGQRCVIYVEDFEGRVGVMTKIEGLEAVADSLDRRGIRELALATAIDKSYKYEFMACILQLDHPSPQIAFHTVQHHCQLWLLPFALGTLVGLTTSASMLQL